MIINLLYRLVFESPYQRLILIVLGAVFFIPFIGNIHLFDWDEINFAEISREMTLTGDYFISKIDFKPFYEKPPLFNWIQIVSFKIFGTNEFSARFPNAFFGILSLILMYEAGRKIRSKSFGMVWALCYMSAFFPFFYFKSGVIDPVFNFFIFSSVLLLYKAFDQNDRKYYIYSGLVCGLAVLVKGPVAILLLFLTWFAVFIFYKRKFSSTLLLNALLLSVSIILVLSIWLLPMIIGGGGQFFNEFFVYMLALLTKDVATHGQPFYYHFVVVFFGCFPISIFGLRNLLNNQSNSNYSLNKWMFVLFWVVMLVFSLVKTKIVHYSSMTYFPLSFLAADALLNIKPNVSKKRGIKLFISIGVVFSLIFMLIPFFNYFKEKILKWVVEDKVAYDIIHELNFDFSFILISFVFVASIFGFYYFYKRTEVKKAIMLYALCFAVFFNLFLFKLLPIVEHAVQGGAISFYKKFADKDVYLTTLGFHSYGKIYYFNKKPKQAQYSNDELIELSLDKPVYFITKSDFKDVSLLRKPGIRFIEQRGAYKLYEKSPTK